MPGLLRALWVYLLFLSSAVAQQRAQLARIELEKTKGTADQQANLAASQVGITIKQNEADARKAQAGGEAGATVVLGETRPKSTRMVVLSA